MLNCASILAVIAITLNVGILIGILHTPAHPNQVSDPFFCVRAYFRKWARKRASKRAFDRKYRS